MCVWAVCVCVRGAFVYSLSIVFITRQDYTIHVYSMFILPAVSALYIIYIIIQVEYATIDTFKKPHSEDTPDNGQPPTTV